MLLGALPFDPMLARWPVLFTSCGCFCLSKSLGMSTELLQIIPKIARPN